MQRDNKAMLPRLADLNEPYQSRLGRLKAGSYRIAYYYDYPDDSTFRYRVFNMIEALEYATNVASGPSFAAAWFCYADRLALNEVVDSCDVLILVRARYSGPVASAVCRARALGRKVLYDVDDLVFDVDKIPLLAATLDQNFSDERVWEYWFQYVSRIRAALLICDEVVVTNERLGLQVLESCNKNFRIIPNFFNFRQEQISTTVYNQKLEARQDYAKDFCIGYFSGSPSHNKDFALAADSLVRILKEYHHVRFLLVGFLELDARFDQFRSRVEKLELVDSGTLQCLIGRSDLNISPLQNNTFTRCKSELKYFEAAIVGTPTLASNLGSFKDAIEHGKTGWLADQHQWNSRLFELVELASSRPATYSSISAAALRSASNVFNPRNFGAAVTEIFD
ncbi:glycosyltransferase [Methylobacterium mesophilicum]